MDGLRGILEDLREIALAALEEVLGSPPLPDLVLERARLPLQIAQFAKPLLLACMARRRSGQRVRMRRAPATLFSGSGLVSPDMYSPIR